MIIDCDACEVRYVHCSNCAVGALLGRSGRIEFDDSERRALALLTEHGLLPPLRLVPALQAESAQQCRQCESAPVAHEAMLHPDSAIA